MLAKPQHHCSPQHQLQDPLPVDKITSDMSIICLPLRVLTRKECRRNSSQSATRENDHEHARHQKKGKGKYPIAVSKRKCNRILCSIGHVVIGRNCGTRLSAPAHTTTRNHGRPPHKQHPPHSQSNNHHHSGNRVTMMTSTTNTYRQWWSCLGGRRRCWKGETTLMRLLESAHR